MFRGRGTHRPQRSAGRRLAWLALPASVAAAIGLWATPGFAAGAYHATQPVNVRSGPGTGTPVIGHEPNGAAFSLLCQWQGSTNVGGNSTWDKVAFANSLTGAISDDLTNTPSFNSYAPGTGACGATAAPTSGGGSLGGVDLQRACDTQYSGRGLRATAANANNPYSWQCVGSGVSLGIDVSSECQLQYGYGAVAAVSNAASAWSWYCHWNVTPQMQNAASWAIAQIGAVTSAHYGGNWSGWCEQFAEQAEGFKFTFGSALDDYRAEYAANRIHSDSNPPVGALVFYDGGTSGHVAVSIGNGQEVGTYGYVDNQYPIMQYAVRGFLTNNYLGWALPFGS